MYLKVLGRYTYTKLSENSRRTGEVEIAHGQTIFVVASASANSISGNDTLQPSFGFSGFFGALLCLAYIGMAVIGSQKECDAKCIYLPKDVGTLYICRTCGRFHAS